ncbi:PBP1A family penicillin-binding protein [Bacteriovoracales bacterium]|nr:PBP1A family penicillin-binding protein [Bacteriovoracales bacterium]
MGKLILKIFWGSITAFFLAITSIVSVIIYFSLSLPQISTLSDYKPPVPSQILSKRGVVLAEIGLEKRDIAKMEEIPKVLIDAFLSAEDDSFYKHKGVDYLGVLRALVVNIKAGRIVQGGSTITQQVAKSLLLSKERSVSRKIKDFLLAQKIEKRFSKEEILFLYLNQVYLGGGFYGVKSAFRGYYGKELAEATIAESAMIAGLLVAPGKYSPYISPEYAKKRQSYVLKRMYENKRISIEEYKKAKNERLMFKIRRKKTFKAGYFTDWVRQRVISIIGEKRFLRDGFRVQTTLDWPLQKVAEREVRKGVKGIDKRQGFLGPLTTFNDLLQEEEFEINFRKEMLKGDSQYFYLTEDNQKKYEYEFDEEIFSKAITHQDEWIKEIGEKNFYPGYLKSDQFVKHLEVGKSYKAIVKKVDDYSRMIYVSLGKVTGVIPYNNFNWAHERVIDEKRKYFQPVTRPSKIVKKGDVILVEVKKAKVRATSYFHKPFLKRIKKQKDIYSKLRTERYVLCMLDQNADAQGALVSIAPKNGEIVSFVGGKDFEISQFNRAIQSKRQPGSSFKPFLFAAALENGFIPSSIIIDSPEALGGVNDDLNWKPRNYDGKFKGPITFRKALEQSRNVPTIKIAKELGVSKITNFVKRIGLEVKLEEDLSLALGSFGVSLVDIVSAYSIFPNGGKKIKLKSIVSIIDRNGNYYDFSEYKDSKLAVEPEQKEEALEEEFDNGEKVKKVNPYHLSLGGNQVYDRRLSYIMSNLLKGVVLNGTGRRAKSLSHFLGGKTGTTNSYVDAWFLGFSHNLVTGVWTGFDDNQTLGWGETGSKSALPIWKGFMNAGLKKFGEHDFKIPLGIINVLIDPKKGILADENTQETFMEAFVEGTEPGNQDNLTLSENKDQDSGDILADDEYYNNQ